MNLLPVAPFFKFKGITKDLSKTPKRKYFTKSCIAFEKRNISALKQHSLNNKFSLLSNSLMKLKRILLEDIPFYGILKVFRYA